LSFLEFEQWNLPDAPLFTHVCASTFNAQNGYLVYTVWVLDESNNAHQVFVDPGNGKVLAQKIAMVGPVFLDPSSIGIMNPGSMGSDLG
jgi:hypothetical protein